LLQVNYTTGFAPRAKARSNFAALQAISERLPHRERQEKDIFDVTGQRYNALNDYASSLTKSKIGEYRATTRFYSARPGRVMFNLNERF
jgi:hypothetical protein